MAPTEGRLFYRIVSYYLNNGVCYQMSHCSRMIFPKTKLEVLIFIHYFFQ